MIKTVGDLIHSFIEHEKEELRGYSFIGHPTMIGDMYEGLTHEVASRALPLGPKSDLRIVSGKVIGSSGILSNQIDCMIVEGEGKQIPYTKNWLYPSEQVLMMIEVKKTLYKTELEDAIDKYNYYFNEVYQPKDMVRNLLSHAWRSIHGTDLPARESVSELDETSQALYHALVCEANMPVRVVIGYDGYKDQETLREGLLNIIEERVSKKLPGVTPVVLPNLIVVGDSSLIKLNGMPYGAPFDATKQSWPFYGSRGSKSIHIFLEMLWTRLNFFHGYSSSIFGEDLDLEAVRQFLDARPAFLNKTHVGWHIDVTQPKDFNLDDENDKPWEPQKLTKAEYAILYPLCNGNEVNSKNEKLLEFLTEEGVTLQEVTETLKQKRLASLEGECFHLLTEELMLGFVPGLGCVAAENNSGRLTRWLKKRGFTS